MNAVLRSALAIAGLVCAAQATAEVIFYEREEFGGRSFTAVRSVNNFDGTGFNDRASSVVVLSNRWEVCEDAQFSGRCVILRPGRYGSLESMGMSDRVSSVRIVSNNARYNDDRYAPQAAPVYDNRRRNNERVYQADVTSVRAVVGAPEQRCWVEREQVNQGRSSANVGGAVVGALLGGVLGHQIGSGRGNDAATAVGAIGGAVVGSNVGRDRNSSYTQDVQRCTNTSSSYAPEYWDVTYNFRGQEHRVQMTTPPGSTVTVNSRGEPRA